MADWQIPVVIFDGDQISNSTDLPAEIADLFA